MSNYGGGNNPKARVMMTEEEECMEGLYATNDSGREPRVSGSNTVTMVVDILRKWGIS